MTLSHDEAEFISLLPTDEEGGALNTAQIMSVVPTHGRLVAEAREAATRNAMAKACETLKRKLDQPDLADRLWELLTGEKA